MRLQAALAWPYWGNSQPCGDHELCSRFSAAQKQASTWARSAPTRFEQVLHPLPRSRPPTRPLPPPHKMPGPWIPLGQQRGPQRTKAQQPMRRRSRMAGGSTHEQCIHAARQIRMQLQLPTPEHLRALAPVK